MRWARSRPVQGSVITLIWRDGLLPSPALDPSGLPRSLRLGLIPGQASVPGCEALRLGSCPAKVSVIQADSLAGLSGSSRPEHSERHRARGAGVYGLSKVALLRRQPTVAAETGWARIPVSHLPEL